MIRVVIDTNNLVSGTIAKRGKSFELLRAWRDGRFELVTSQALIAEFVEVMDRPRIQEKYHIEADEVAEMVALVLERAILVAEPLQVSVVTADPKDDMFVACALSGGAKYIVSGNHHLLDVKRHKGIRLLTVARFLRLLARVERFVAAREK